MNHPIITKVARRLMPTVILCCFFASFDRISFSLAKFQLQAALTLSDPADWWGSSLFVVAGALLVGASVVFFPLPPARCAKDGAA